MVSLLTKRQSLLERLARQFIDGPRSRRPNRKVGSGLNQPARRSSANIAPRSTDARKESAI